MTDRESVLEELITKYDDFDKDKVCNVYDKVNGKRDFAYFCVHVLGYHKDDDLGFYDLNKDLLDLCSFMQEGAKSKLVLTPRYTLKSTVADVGWILWKLVNNANLRFLIYSDSASKAQGFLQGVKNHIEGKAPNSRFRELYGAWETDAHKGKWNESEIEISARTKSFIEPTVETGGIESSKIGRHYDILVFDDIVSDINTTTKAQMDKVHDCYKKSLSLLKPGGDIVIIGCLVAGTKVTMSDGSLRNIEKVKVGEKVISYGYDRQHQAQTVEAMIPQGVGKVYRLKTPNHTIEATANHPFLTPDGFKKLDKLKPGDLIYALSYLPRIKKTDLDYEDLWVLGFMYGDGWLTKNKKKYDSISYITCVAKDVHGYAEKAVEILSRKTGAKFKLTKYGYYRAEKADLGRYLIKLGFKGRAKTKRIPKYVFSLSVKHREAFLDGFIKADGFCGALDNIEISNERLTKDLKNLAEICGYKVSNIYHRRRLQKAPHSKDYILTDSYHISIGRRKRLKRFRLERIKKVEYVGEKEVFDLTVSETHNFIASGLVVHNTRWNYGDTYGRIIEENKEKNNFDIFIRDAEEMRDGKLIYEDIGLDRKFLDYQRAEQGSYIYSSLYRNNPADDQTALFKIENFEYYTPTPKFHENMFITGSCDPSGAGEDFTAITVVGTDSKKNLYILDAVNEHLNPSQIINQIIRLNYKWGFHKFIVERNFFKGMLEREFREEEKSHIGNPHYKSFSFSEDLISSSKQRNFSRVLALQPYHERGAIKLPGKSLNTLSKVYSELAYQMIRYSHVEQKCMAPHDDLIMSLAFHMDIIRPGGKAKEEEVHWTTAVARERVYIDSLNSRLPRKYRRMYKPSFQ